MSAEVDVLWGPDEHGHSFLHFDLLGLGTAILCERYDQPGTVELMGLEPKNKSNISRMRLFQRVMDTTRAEGYYHLEVVGHDANDAKLFADFPPEALSFEVYGDHASHPIDPKLRVDIPTLTTDFRGTLAKLPLDSQGFKQHSLVIRAQL